MIIYHQVPLQKLYILRYGGEHALFRTICLVLSRRRYESL